MGAVAKDLHERERQYEADYPGLHTIPGVKALLRDWTKLRLNAYDRGDYDALVLLLDLETALGRARLTWRQRQVIDLVYGEDLTQQMAADALGVTRENVTIMENLAVKHIAKIFGNWETGE